MIVEIILIGIIICLLVIIFNYKKEFKNISKQIDEHLDDYVNIKTRTMDKDLEKVVKQINLLYDKKQEANARKKKIEEDLRASISNMSHDLRTPLTSIMGYMQLVKSSMTSNTEKEEYLEIIESRTRFLQELIENFYELSRIEGNEYKFNYKKVNLSNLLCENIAVFYNNFIERDIEPIININESLKDIISDENAINRIFSNLINNMLKHGEKYIEINLREENNMIVTEFINSAPDLTEEDVDKMFDRFYTANKSRSDKNTGLGLCITKTLVEGLGHNIFTELNDGKLIIYIQWKV